MKVFKDRKQTLSEQQVFSAQRALVPETVALEHKILQDTQRLPQLVDNHGHANGQRSLGSPRFNYAWALPIGATAAFAAFMIFSPLTNLESPSVTTGTGAIEATAQPLSDDLAWQDILLKQDELLLLEL